MSKKETDSDKEELSEEEFFRQRQKLGQQRRVQKFYYAAQPQRGREARIGKTEALLEIKKLRPTLILDEAIKFCDEAISKLEEQIKEEEKDKDGS